MSAPPPLHPSARLVFNPKHPTFPLPSSPAQPAAHPERLPEWKRWSPALCLWSCPTVNLHTQRDPRGSLSFSRQQDAGKAPGAQSCQRLSWKYLLSTNPVSLARWLSGKESACRRRRLGLNPGFDPWVRKIPWRRKWRLIPGFLSEKSHGQRSLVGYSPGGHKRIRGDLATEQQQ